MYLQIFITTYEDIRWRNSEGQNLNFHHLENLKFNLSCNTGSTYQFFIATQCVPAQILVKA
jgi:hypothetical protein